MNTKICCTCKQELPLNNYSKDISNADGLRGNCKKCVQIYTKTLRENSAKIHTKEFYILQYEKKETKDCSKCHEKKEVLLFSANKYCTDGFHTYCKNCENIRGAEETAKLKNIVYTHYTPKCSICKIDDLDVLAIDHVNNDGAIERVKIPKTKNLYKKIIKENFPNTYQVLCHNCNWKKAKQNNKKLHCNRDKVTTEFKLQSEKLTQNYSTMGNKLLQNMETLHNIQNNREFKPVTIQLAPCEICSSSCSFCSVGFRPLKSYLPFNKIKKLLEEFKFLGAKSLEITGGGQPDLYFDKENNKNINDVISYAFELNYNIGIITNANDLTRIKPENYHKISWIRISLIKLEEGFTPEDYNFRGFPYEKLGFSYIIYDKTEASPSVLKTKIQYEKTSKKSIEKIAKLVELHPKIKFVRIAGDCLEKGANQKVKEEYSTIISTIDKYNKFFIKDIGELDGPYENFCGIGLIRPYIAPHPNGNDYQVYICTSHVLNTRTYDLSYSLGSIDNIISIWNNANKMYKEKGYPYEVKKNSGCGWGASCKFCYYHNNNQILHSVAKIDNSPDKNFI